MSFRYYMFKGVDFGYFVNGVGFVPVYTFPYYSWYARINPADAVLYFAFCNGVGSGSACIDTTSFQYLNSSPRSVSLSPVSSDDYYVFSSFSSDPGGFLYSSSSEKKDILFAYSDYYSSVRSNVVIYDYKDNMFYLGYFDSIDSLRYYSFPVVPYFLFSAYVDPVNYNHQNSDSPFSSFLLPSGFTFHYKVFSESYFDFILSRVDNSSSYYLTSDDYSPLSSLFPFVFKPVYCSDGLYFSFSRAFVFPPFFLGCSGVENLYINDASYYLVSSSLRFHSFSSFLSFLGDYYFSSPCLSCCPDSVDVLQSILAILGG